ncbi:hypothetical protein niasHT_021280 [Heterodera trifolii]|uniref:Uncharacterized protein n=1 Tax=Heterodera trifolii TaxID=157864 RepID=A0ABD2JNE4_9BILA
MNGIVWLNFVLGAVLLLFSNCADCLRNVDWTTGKQLKDEELNKAPIVISDGGEIVLQAGLIKNIVPNPITLYFNTTLDIDNRHLKMSVCRVGECTAKAIITFCFLGQMDPANARLNSQYHMENYEDDNEIATKCKMAQQTKWAKHFEQDKVLHGFQIVMSETEQEQAMDLYTSTHQEKRTHVDLYGEFSCSNISFGEYRILDGYVDTAPNNTDQLFKNRSFWGYLLSMEEPVTALAYDMLAGLPQKGGKLGVIGHQNNDKCPFAIKLGGENGLVKCVGKMCKDSA